MSRKLPLAFESRKDVRDGLKRRSLRVGIVLTEHFTLSAFTVFVDHLCLAACESDRGSPVSVQWSIMSARQEPIIASCGVALPPTSSLLPPDRLDYVVVVGGILLADPQVDELTIRYLREVGTGHTPLIGIWSGSFVLCQAGLMKGRRSCVSWHHYRDFREAFPDHEVVADRLFLADGPRTTCVGGAGAAALASHLIERHLGRATAHMASQVLLFDGPRQGGYAQPHQALRESINGPHITGAIAGGISEEIIVARLRGSNDRQHIPLATRLDGSHPSIALAAQLMEANIEEPLSLAELAQLINVSQRQLQRLFRCKLGITPAQYYAAVRLRRARELLQQTVMPIKDIAVACGFRLPCHFSRSYRGHFGHPPGGERQATVGFK